MEEVPLDSELSDSRNSPDDVQVNSSVLNNVSVQTEEAEEDSDVVQIGLQTGVQVAPVSAAKHFGSQQAFLPSPSPRQQPGRVEKNKEEEGEQAQSFSYQEKKELFMM